MGDSNRSKGAQPPIVPPGYRLDCRHTILTNTERYFTVTYLFNKGFRCVLQIISRKLILYSIICNIGSVNSEEKISH